MANIDLKKIFTPKRAYAEALIKRYAIYSDKIEDARIAPISSMFDISKLEFISAGLMSRVFKYPELGFVVKEGRWDMDFELFKGTRIPLNVKLIQKIYKVFSHEFLPDLKETLRQYRDYLKFTEYFGFFSDKNSYHHTNIEGILSNQRHIRNSLLFVKPEIEKYFHFKINPKIDAILLSDSRLHNFLPKEYLLYGKSISKENEGKNTSYIIQEFVKGNVLHDIDQTALPIEVTRELILLLYLILLMDYQTGLLPDTRPKYIVIQAYDWLLETDNVMLSDKGIKFIDTRWMWKKGWNPIRRGIIIPEMIENLAKGYINFLLDSLP